MYDRNRGTGRFALGCWLETASFDAVGREITQRDAIGAPGQIRTADLLVRSQTLYPTELRAQHLRV